jgi:hypothetical protein
MLIAVYQVKDIEGLNPGSGSQFFEPRLARLRLGVFDPLYNITN